MSMTEIDAMVKELGYEVKLSEDADVLDMLVFVQDTRLINIVLEHILACSQEQFYSQVVSNIFINLDDDFGTNTRVAIEELDDNYGAIVPVGRGVSHVEKLNEELNEEGLNQEAGGQGKELNEEGLTQMG
ncbi:unnamed protein product [Prunus armeniaca]|uniref:Uncharacterized protein n=1 Tax=Prunus armeniaca TaxID=36596 RepID=A0A6J5XWQ3_PRUAR|nr:unnamed protein product [Prunus armeniaca]CAB4316245.1 unnamed protein product [Prunus armeniaca]